MEKDYEYWTSMELKNIQAIKYQLKVTYKVKRKHNKKKAFILKIFFNARSLWKNRSFGIGTKQLRQQEAFADTEVLKEFDKLEWFSVFGGQGDMFEHASNTVVKC